jgi:hypothetical protein
MVVEECEKSKEPSVFDLVRKYWVETGEDGSGVAIPAHELDANQRRVYSHPCCKDAVEDSLALSFMLKSSWGSPRGAISCAECLVKCFAGCPCREVSLLLGRTLSSLKTARGGAGVLPAVPGCLEAARCSPSYTLYALMWDVGWKRFALVTSREMAKISVLLRAMVSCIVLL